MRNLLRNDNVLKEALTKQWDETDAGLIAGVMVDVNSPDAAVYLVNFMKKYKLPDDRVPQAYQKIAQYTPANKLQSVVDEAFGNPDASLEQKALMYRAFQQYDKKLFTKIAPQLAADLFKKYPATDLRDDDVKYNNQTTAIAIAGDYKVKSLIPDLKSFLNQGHKIGQNLRSNVLRALMKIDPANASIGGEILKNDSVIDFRIRIATAMGEFPGKQVNTVLNGLTSIPLGLQEPVVIALAGSPDGKDIIFDKVKKGQIMARMLLQPRAQELILLNASKKQQQELTVLTADLPPVSAEKQQVIDKRLASFDALDKRN